MQIDTHRSIDPRLVGEPVAIGEGRATVRLVTVPEMAADERGLVHGGFVFGLADYAGMLALNHPNVVLGSAETRFLRPVRVGDVLVAEARHTGDAGKKKLVSVEVRCADAVVVSAELTCFVPARHVLEPAPAAG